MDAFATSISLALQHGVPLRVLLLLLSLSSGDLPPPSSLSPPSPLPFLPPPLSPADDYFYILLVEQMLICFTFPCRE